MPSSVRGYCRPRLSRAAAAMDAPTLPGRAAAHLGAHHPRRVLPLHLLVLAQPRRRVLYVGTSSQTQSANCKQVYTQETHARARLLYSPPAT